MKRRALAVLIFSLLLGGCGASEAPPAPKAATNVPKPPPPVPNHTSVFPLPGQTNTRVVPDHILDMKAMPGGSLAGYDVKGKKYQMFIIDADSTQTAAFMMLDMKGEMAKDPEYIAYMGGYFGAYRDQPFYCFSKLHYLAGVIGLPMAQADPLMRSLAAQLH